ncbi:UNVERIFIED_CONTAM: hypothetical protein K2H54_051506 [Gekko kuhli]
MGDTIVSERRIPSPVVSSSDSRGSLRGLTGTPGKWDCGGGPAGREGEDSRDTTGGRHQPTAREASANTTGGETTIRRDNDSTNISITCLLLLATGLPGEGSLRQETYGTL